jgi:hypothetical protein
MESVHSHVEYSAAGCLQSVCKSRYLWPPLASGRREGPGSQLGRRAGALVRSVHDETLQLTDRSAAKLFRLEEEAARAPEGTLL